jgi:thiamine biosynthesis lipoprotein
MGVEAAVCGASAEELDAIRGLFDEWDGVFSRFRPDSELNRVNRDPLDTVIVSRLFAFALRAGISAAAATNGLVDPTLGAAVEAAAQKDSARLGAQGKWRSIRLSGRLLSRPPGTRLDLNGVVKSLAVDSALELISGDGFVSAGGDVAVRGGAMIGLPSRGEVQLRAGGMATSGSTKRRWLRGGSVQHHLIDPRTGRPAESRWDEVTVAAGSCLAADVAAKAAFLLSEDGPAWLDERSLAGRFRDGEVFLENRAWNELLLASAA